MDARGAEIDVAKAKKTETGREDWGSQPVAFSIRGSAKWKGEIVKLADSLGIDPSALFDMGVRQLARTLGRPELPDRLK